MAECNLTIHVMLVNVRLRYLPVKAFSLTKTQDWMINYGPME